MRRRGISKIYLYPGIFIVAVLVLAGLRIVAVNWQEPTEGPGMSPATKPATQASTVPATTQAADEKPLVELLDVIRADHPDYPTTEPLELPSDLADAARVVIDRPVYLDGMGNLWITHPRGQAIDELLRKPIKKRTIVVNERVLYVYWPMNGGQPVVLSRSEREPAQTIHQRGLPARPFVTADAGLERIVTVGDRVYGFSPEFAPGQPQELKLFHDVWVKKAGDPELTTQVVVREPSETPLVAAVAGDGLVVWGPWDNGKKGTAGARYVDPDGKIIRLDRSTGWVDQPIHMVPLADGSVLAIGRTETGIELVLKPLTEAAPPSPEQVEKITTLARKLADRDPLVREDTQRQLEAMGPSIFQELEKIKDNLAVESQVRIESILGQRFAPTIAGLRPLEGDVKTAARFRDGGCVLLLTGGGVYDENGQDKTLIPAWISIRPGHYLERIDPSKVANFVVGQHKMAAFGSEWVLVDPTLGPQRWIGNKLYPLAGPDYKQFDEFIGIDAQRRWLFKSSKEPGKTLILDTTLPDLEPKLPVWAIDAPDGAGWLDTGWPAVKRGEAVFVLGERGWRTPEKNETFEKTPPKVLPTATTNPSGDRFNVTTAAINAVPKKGPPIASTLPSGTSAQSQIFWAADHLFLYSEPGKLHRFSWRDGKLKFEKTFEADLPKSDPKRIWIDPAGRLCLVEETALWITFPTGRLPGAISQLMLQSR